MARLIPENTLEQVRAASDIVEIIGGYFPLKRAGGNHVALCPFHKEKSPSFNVNPQRQIYHCFGCHAGGDVFKFIQEYEHIGFLDAVKRLAERAGIPLEMEDDPRAGEKRREKDALLKVHEQLAQRWHSVLLNDAAGQPARDYLQARGVSAEAVEAFRLGFAPGDWEDTVNWAKAQKHDPRVMEQAGLVASKDGRQYGRFRARLMFPIHDEQGRVIGFSGRVLEADVKGAKYVNSPETPLFHKSKVIYGLDKARRPIIAAESVLICEGQLDTIACHMAGIENVVAPQGTALTADHARVLKRYANEVILCFDSDTAGQAAAVRSLDGLLESELAIRVMTVPAPHDPDSFIRDEGAEAFRELMEAALVALRQDLRALGFERSEHTRDPEDHLAAMCEVMAMLIAAQSSEQFTFFQQHLAPWASRCWDDLAKVDTAFYSALGQLGSAFMESEQARLSDQAAYQPVRIVEPASYDAGAARKATP